MLINDNILWGKLVVQQVQIHIGALDVNPYFEAVLNEEEDN